MTRYALTALALTLTATLGLASPPSVADEQAHDDERSNHDERSHEDNKDLVLVTHDDGSVSLIKRDKKNRDAPYFEAERVQASLIQGHWPANQYVGSTHWWWVGQTNGSVRGFEFRRDDPLQEIVDDPDRHVTIDTYITPGRPDAGANFAGTTPTGKTLWNSAREVDEIQEIDADPHSRTFGQILTRIDVPHSAKASTPTATLGAMRPCDMSITPNGKFLFEPDLGGETVTAVDIRTKRVINQLQLEPLVAGTRVRPFMLTTNGKIALVENLEGTYAVLDVSDPYNMYEIKRLTQADGVGMAPQTSEFAPDGKYAYLIANGSPSVPGVISVLDLKTLTIPKQITLPDGCRPHAGDFSRDGRHFFVNCANAQSVAVVDTKAQALVQNISLADNPTPRGVLVR
jgi:DNA-binding beta-propeller fold protein YncE